MKPKQLLFTLLALLASSNAAAQERTEYVERSEYDAKIDGIYYRFNYDFDYDNECEILTATVTSQYRCYERYIDINEWGEEYVSYEELHHAYSDYSGDVLIPESVTYQGQTYLVTEIDEYAFYFCSDITSVTIPNSVTSINDSAFQECYNLTSITIPNSVTSIGNSAFGMCSGLTSITIPGSVTSIEDFAFSDCTSLTSVTIPQGVTSIGSWAFSGCTSLTSITIPNSVTSIEGSAFEDCCNLTSITIPNSVTSIGYAAFLGCSSLTSITIPNSVTSIGNLAFRGCSGLTSIKVDAGNTIYDSRGNCNAIIITATNTLIAGCKNATIPGSVTSIENSAFYGCSGLTSVTIPSSVTSIGGYAFCGCSGLTSVTIPSSVTSIEDSAFYGCSGLTSVTIPSSVTSIGYYAFENCSSLTSMTIPNSVTSIGYRAFYGCTSLTSITIPNSVTSIGDLAFRGCSGLTSITIPGSVTSIGNSAFLGCSGLTSITIPNSVTKISDKVFNGCSSLTSVTIPSSVTSIGGNAFCGCSSLTSITIPNSVTSIGSYAFENCNSLKTITIGSGITYINRGAFSGSNSLESVLINVKVPLNIDEYCFSTYDKDSYSYGKTNATLYVPAGSKAAYEAADYWKEFKNIIEFIHGDVNGDEEIDVLDVVDIVRYTVGTPAETFVPILADINYNGEVNVGDAVALVNEIAGDQNFVKPWRAPQQNSAADDVLTLTSTDNGMSLCMENERNYTAFQLDLYLPEGTDATDMLLNAQRKQGHQLIYNKVKEVHYRVAAISTSNSTFSGYEGELLAVGLEGVANEDVCLRNIRFFTTDGEEHRFDDIVMQSGTATDIASPQQPSNEEAQDIYDLQGRKMVNGKWLNGKSSKGIYIVNGKKVMIK